MARRYGSRRSHYSGRRSSYAGRYSRGHERALKHIEDARRLSAELGGTDKDVKEYFFALSHLELYGILNEYERRHGKAAREYAEATMPKWRTGAVTMSGTVAERLFALLPPRMPLAAKYRLTENLWKHVGPSSKKRLRVGLDVHVESVVEAVEAHIDEVVVNYRVPDNLERRFNWLAAGDVGVKQELLNHLRQMEKSHVAAGARAQLPVMLEHLRSPSGQHTHRLAQILSVGKHELEILLDKSASGVALEEWTSWRSSASDAGCLGSTWFWVVVGLALLYWLAQ